MADSRRLEPADDRPQRAADRIGLSADPVDAQAGAITHDVNNLLAAILGHAEVALTRRNLPDGAKGDLIEIGRAARQAALLTRQLVAIHRPPTTRRSPLDLRIVVEAMAAMLRPLLGEAVELRAETGARPVLIVADTADLEGVVLNLAINARDAMPSGGTLTLSSAVLPGAGGRRAALSVSDTGTGMDPVTRARAFEPYFTTKGPGRGSGLGLASVAASAKRNGWTLHLETAPGEGSRFIVLIPLAPRASTGG